MVPRVSDVPIRVFSTPSIDEEEPKSPVDKQDESITVSNNQQLRAPKTRPESQRSTTEPNANTLQQAYFTPRPSSSHRNRSPYARSHLRSSSSGAPLMTRAHSSPAMHTAATRAFDLSTPSTGSLSPASPMRSPARQRSPFRPQEDSSSSGGSSYFAPPRSPSWYDGAIESIQEDSELDLTPKAHPHAPKNATAPFSRSSSLRRQRPASPLYGLPQHTSERTTFPASVIDQNTPLNYISSPSHSSPALGPQRYAFETYTSGPGHLLHHAHSATSLSSMPSTPTSARSRSRSPSISSLETIEDAPDLESEAVEMDQLERLKLAAEREERGEMLDDQPQRRRLSFESGGKGFGFFRGGGGAGARERKRWSVCGAERRVDLDLDTIWED